MFVLWQLILERRDTLEGDKQAGRLSSFGTPEIIENVYNFWVN